MNTKTLDVDNKSFSASRTTWYDVAKYHFPGLLLCAVLAIGGMILGQNEWMQAHGFSALSLSIVLGIVVGNTVYPHFAAMSGVGVHFSKQNLLRIGVVMYGLRLTVQDIGQVGIAGIITDTVVLCSTFALACYIGIKWLGMDSKTVMLIGAGSSICGAAAVMATEPVVRARAEQVTVAVATVVVFGTLAIFLYPALFKLNQDWHVLPSGVDQFGIYAGSTIHEVAQVVAAARSVGTHAADTAVIAKMVRVMMLAPFLILLSLWLSKKESKNNAQMITAPKFAIPWFAFAFVGVVLFNSLQLLPSATQPVTTQIDTILLAMAMAALGLSTHISSIRKAGFKPLLLALILFAWLVMGGALINRWIFELLK